MNDDIGNSSIELNKSTSTTGVESSIFDLSLQDTDAIITNIIKTNLTIYSISLYTLLMDS